MEQDEEPPRRPGTFVKGFDPRRSKPEQRRLGRRNKIPQQVLKGIFDGAVRHGRDGQGKDGFNGYCEFLAAKHPKEYITLLARLMPVHIKTDDASNGGVDSNFTVHITGVPSGTFFTAEECEQIMRNELPPAIEHHESAPVLVNDNDDSEPPPQAA